MTEAFENLEDDFNAVVSSTQPLIQRLPGISGAERPQYVQDIRDRLGNAERYIKMMEAEARAGNVTQKRVMTQSVRTARSKLQKLEDDLRRAELMSEEARRQRQQQINQMDDRERALEYNRQNQRAGNKLADADRVIGETEQIAVNVADEFNRQGEVLRRADQQVVDIRQDAKEASSLLNKLKLGVFCNTIVLYFAIAALIIVLVIVILRKTPAL